MTLSRKTISPAPHYEPESERLLPAESIALTVARAQVARGENPGINVTTVLVMALDRLTASEPPAPVHREEGKGCDTP